MAAVLLSAGAEADLGRLVDFLLEADPDSAAATGEIIFEALGILARHPRIGRPSDGGLLELLISRGRTGYVALYDDDEASDRVVVHAIRHQREAGYDD